MHARRSAKVILSDGAERERQESLPAIFFRRRHCTVREGTRLCHLFKEAIGETAERGESTGSKL